MAFLFLTGMPGSGKSTLAPIIANHLKLPWYDSDEWVVNNHQKSIAEIFRVDGESAFRQYEFDAMREICQQPRGVVATGGGAFCQPMTHEMMIQNGVVLFLHIPVTVLSQRLSYTTSERPLLSTCQDKSEMTDRISQQLNERLEWYRRDSIEIALTGSETVPIAAELVIKQILKSGWAEKK